MDWKLVNVTDFVTCFSNKVSLYFVSRNYLEDSPIVEASKRDLSGCMLGCSTQNWGDEGACTPITLISQFVITVMSVTTDHLMDTCRKLTWPLSRGAYWCDLSCTSNNYYFFVLHDNQQTNFIQCLICRVSKKYNLILSL